MIMEWVHARIEFLARDTVEEQADGSRTAEKKQLSLDCRLAAAREGHMKVGGRSAGRSFNLGNSYLIDVV